VSSESHGGSPAPGMRLFLCTEMNFRQMVFSETQLLELWLLGNQALLSF
jgi:hypothetical protein